MAKKIVGKKESPKLANQRGRKWFLTMPSENMNSREGQHYFSHKTFQGIALGRMRIICPSFSTSINQKAPLNPNLKELPPTGKLPKSVVFGLTSSEEYEEFTAFIYGDPRPYTH